MGDSHDGKAYRFHDQDGILPMDQNDFFGQPALPVASYHFWGAPGYHPQNSSNNSNVANGQVQDGDYMQRGFYGSASSHLPGLMSTTTGPRPSINDMTLGLSSAQHLNHQFSLHAPDMSLGFNGQAATQSPGQCCHITQQYELQQYSHPPFQQIPIKTQQQDDDCISVGSSTTDCDSNCGLADPCTDESCAGRDDACTDRHCPEKDCPDTNCPEKMPSEVVVAAATLTAFGVEPPQQQRHDTSYQGIGGHELLPPSQQPHFDGMLDMATFTPLDLVKHIGVAHNDGASSNCMGPCPIENPQVFQHFQHCPFPVTFDFQLDSFSDILNPFSLNSFNNDGSVNFPSQSQAQFHGCGAEFSNPEALVEHFNTQHRHALENVLAQSNACSGSAAPQLSARTFSSPSSKAVGPSPPSATHSPHVSFPPTPLSLSQDISNTSKPSSHHSRSSTVSQTGPGNENEPQPCLWCSPETGERCGQVFRDSEALFAHVNSEHIQKLEKGHRGFLCNWENCKRRGDGKEGFPQRSKIERHMHTHIGRKPYACDVCSQRFSAQQALTQHMLIHTDEKPLRCDWEGCGKTFRQQSALTMHRRIHTGDKPLKCPICGKAFSESSNLSKHKRIHETKGRFSCTEPGCDKTFHRLDQLRRHQKSHPSATLGSKTLEEMVTECNNVMDGLKARMENGGEPMRKKRNR